MDTNENVQTSTAAPPAASAPAPTEQPSASPAPEQTPPQPPSSPEQRPRTVTQRISQLTARYHEEQRAREAAEAKLAEAERRQALTQQFSQLDAEKPDINRYQDLASYQQAMSDWTAKRTLAAAQAQWEERMQAQQAEQARQAQQFYAQQQRVAAENAVLEQKMAEGSKKYPDFEAAVTNPELPQIRGTPLFGIVLQAEHAVDVAYALAKNPAELERLAELSLRAPQQAAWEVFRMDTKFAGNGPTSAPPPPPPRNGSTQVPKDWNQMSTREHAEAYWAQKRKRAAR